MQDQNDNMTETRGSIEQTETFWGRLRLLLCPCLAARAESKNIDTTATSKTIEKHDSNSIYGYNLARGQQQPSHRKTSLDVAAGEGRKEGLLEKKSKRSRGELKETVDIELEDRSSRSEGVGFSCSVCSYAEEELVAIGMNESHLLVKIQRVDLNPNLASLRNNLSNSPKRRKEKEAPFHLPEFERFWNQRYLIFERFDEGVKLDEGSWSRTPPEQVSEFVASKCSGAKVILDGFAGVGGTAIKLANVSSCVKMVANDFNGKKLGCLLNNAKVYEVECNIEISEQEFLAVDKRNVDVVFVQPPCSPEALASKCLSIVDFEPSLNKILMKCLRLAADVLLLLPPQTSIEALCSCLNKCATELRKMRGSCSIKVDKLYFQNEFRYILISFGSIVQRDVKLNDELEYIYSRLRRKGDSTFRHKKLIKRIREEQGMLELLNLLKLSEKRCRERQQSGATEDLIDSFFQTVRERNVISREKLEKMIEEQTPDAKKRPSQLTLAVEKKEKEQKKEKEEKEEKEEALQPVMEEEKVEENDLHYRQSEQTQSDYSHYSYLSGLDKGSRPSRTVRLQSDSFSSVIIKRTLNGSREKRDLSPNGSPVTPTRRNGKNRISHLPERKDYPEQEPSKRAMEL